MLSSSGRLAGVLLLGLRGLAEGQEPYQIAVSIDLVVLPVTVRDRDGRFVDDLREQDFAVYEDGARQALRLFRHEDTPVTVGLVVDHSGSMRRKLVDVIAAAQTFALASHPQDEMFVVNFNERVTVERPASSEPADLAAAISRSPVEGQTALYDALAKAFEQLQTGRHEKKALVVISDGGDNTSRHSLAEVLESARRMDVLIYTIGIYDATDPDRNPGVLRQLARTTGGEAYFPAKQDEVAAMCERIAQDLRHQYTLGYFSQRMDQAAGYRKVRVAVQRAAGERLSVRTREGFLGGRGDGK